MTASADKVQFVLQGSLQQTLPLVKKGIFTEQQLRSIMMERQKHQNKLYSKTYKLSHYLKAIQFEYDLQRTRLYRIKNQQKQSQSINPMFKKQGKTDFSIVKRCLKLWDRTMHKYRFRTHLWKQYLSFCIAIKSKKHFYKALTNSLSFLPFQLDLWKIGVRYEVQVGRNLWKARRLFHKGLKLVPIGQKNIDLTKQLIKFELQFVEMLQSRQKIIQGQDEESKNDMKFIIGENKDKQSSSQQENECPFLPNQGGSEILKLRQYDEVLFVALMDSISKNYKSKTYFQNKQHLSARERSQILINIYLQFLVKIGCQQQNELIMHILQTTIKKLQVYKDQLNGMKLQQKYEQNEQQQMEVQQQDMQVVEQADEQEGDNLLIEQASQHCLLIEQQKGRREQQPLRELTKQQKYANEIIISYQQNGKFDDKLFVKSIKQFCLKPILLAKFLEVTLTHFLSEALKVLIKNDWLRVPLKSLQSILRELNLSQQKSQLLNEELNLVKYFTKQFQKINPVEYISNTQLLREVIVYNKSQGKVQQNNKLFRSILVNCKQNIEFVERAKGLFVQ